MQLARIFEPHKSKYLVLTTDYILPIFITLSIMALGYIALYSPYFRIQEVICSQDYGDCQNPTLVAELDELKGRNLITLPVDELIAKITAGDFTIREAKMIRQLPGRLTLELQSVYPVVALQVEGDPHWVVLDHQFRVIATRTQDPNVPTVIVPGPLTLVIARELGDPLIVQSLSLAKRLADELFVIRSLTLVDEGTIELVLTDGKKAIFTPRKSELEQLRLLQSLLSDATITESISIIDLRFDRPVLR